MSRRPIQASIRSQGGPDGDDGERDQLLEAFSRWASGVAVLAVRDGDDLETLAVSAFTSVSVDPPLVLVCLGGDAGILPMLLEVGRFTVNVLAGDDRRIAAAAANRMPPDPSRFPASGDPVLTGALASFICRVAADYPGGDHRIVVGEVERLELGPEGAPLVYFGREYRGLRD